MKDLTLLTVNFNEKMMTVFMLQSFFKHIDDKYCNYLIVENSSKIDKSLIGSGLNVFDNTNNHCTGNYKQCSKNHASAIDFALKNLIKTKWVLLVDNDIFFKKNLTPLIDSIDNYDCIGEVGWDDAPPMRLFPYFNFINIEKLKKDGINYFDPKRIIEPAPIGKYYGKRGQNTKCWYHDTGSSFYEDIKDSWNIKEIKLDDFIVHNKSHGGPKMSITNFIRKYKDI